MYHLPSSLKSFFKSVIGFACGRKSSSFSTKTISTSTLASLPLAVNVVPDHLTTPERIRKVFKFVHKKIFQDWISHFESVYTKTYVLVLLFSFTLSWLPWVLTFFADIVYHSLQKNSENDAFDIFENLELNFWISR